MNDNDSQSPATPLAARAQRAADLLRTVETIKEYGGAVEVYGVRIEPCDTYGRTDTTQALEEAAAKVRELEEALIELRVEPTDDTRLDPGDLLRHRDLLREQLQTVIEQRDDARTLVDELREELDKAYGGKEEAAGELDGPNVGPITEPIDLTGAETLEEAVYQAVGAASMAWEHVDRAGVFDDRKARGAAAGLLRWIDQHDDGDEAADPDPHCPAEVVVGGTAFGCQRGRDHDGTRHGADTIRFGLVTW